MMKYHEMISRQKTTVAVLRQLLELSVKDFGSLIGKSVSTITKLENGMLKLSEETASLISQETGVSLYWLMDGNPRRKPYLSFNKRPIPNFGAHSPTAFKFPYEKEYFERIQQSHFWTFHLRG